MTFAETRLEHRRLTILRLLEQSGIEANEQHLRQALHALGERLPSLRGELDWLAERRLIALTESHGIAVARLTERGYAVAGGQERAPGVARPRPGDV